MIRMKKKILITGGKGFIGRNLVEQLQHDYEITAPSSLILNLLDSDRVRDFLHANVFDIIIHCATHDASRNSKKEESLILENNLRMFFNLARCRDLYGRMFYFGSGAEYDRDHYIPKMHEDYFGVHVPRNQYGFSKYIMAQYASEVQNIVDLRIFGCFGKYEDWGIRFISNAICRVIYDFDISIRKNVCFDYLYIDDLVKIIRWFIERKELMHKHYNVCTGNSVDLISLAQEITKVSGKKLKIKVGEPGLKAEYSGDNSRLISEMGEFAFTPIVQAMGQLYEWYADNQPNIDKNLLFIDDKI